MERFIGKNAMMAYLSIMAVRLVELHRVLKPTGSRTEFGRFPALQIVTFAEIFQARRPELPPLITPKRRAARVETRASYQKGAQGGLL